MTGPVIPIRAGSGPDRRRLGAEDWARGSTFLEFVVAAGPLRTRLEAAFRRAAPPPESVAAVTGVGRTLRIVAFAAAGDVEATTQVAYAEKLIAAGNNLWLRVFDPESAGDLVTRFLPDVAGASSHFAFFFEDGRACGRWGPRPTILQAQCDAAPAAEAAVRRDAFYLHSDGREQAGEWSAILQTCAAGTP